MHFVAFLQTAQDGDGVLHRGLAHVHLLKPALQCRVLFDVLAELVERGGPDHAQLTTGQHWFEHVAGIHGAFSGPCAHHGMHLVDERDDFTLRVGDLLEHRLQSLLELPAVLGPGHHGGQIQRDEATILEALGYIAVHDAPGQTFHDGGFTHARLTDEDGIVLGAAGQDLNGAPDLLVATDHRV